MATWICPKNGKARNKIQLPLLPQSPFSLEQDKNRPASHRDETKMNLMSSLHCDFVKGALEPRVVAYATLTKFLGNFGLLERKNLEDRNCPVNSGCKINCGVEKQIIRCMCGAEKKEKKDGLDFLHELLWRSNWGVDNERTWVLEQQGGICEHPIFLAIWKIAS